MKTRRIILIGGGIIGLATAYKLCFRFPEARVTVLEKEPTLGRHQSGRNSGVLHAGLYYKPGSLKARLAVKGIREMVAFCREHGVPHVICGTLVVAVDETELPRLHTLLERGQQNGLSGLRLLNSTQMREIEPHVAGLAAVHVPDEGIVDYQRVCGAMEERIIHSGGRIIVNAMVNALKRLPDAWVAQTAAGDFQADYLITAPDCIPIE